MGKNKLSGKKTSKKKINKFINISIDQSITKLSNQKIKHFCKNKVRKRNKNERSTIKNKYKRNL